MAANRFIFAILVVFAVKLASFPSVASGQYSMIGTPFQTGGYGYSENINLSWGIGGRGWNFNWNGGNANPPFGPFAPDAGAQVGGQIQAGPLRGGFRLTASQGADTTLGTQSASVTVPNGGTGFISDTTQRPFVAGIVPVVGDAYYHTTLQERLARLRAAAEQSGQAEAGLSLGKKAEPTAQLPPAAPVAAANSSGPSSAERGEKSVRELRSQQSTAEDLLASEVEAILAKAQTHEAAGELGLARIYYQQAIRRTTGAQQQALLARVQALDGKKP